MALSHAITAYGIVTNAQKSASSAITAAQQNPTARNILLADTARDRVGEAIDNYNYWITTVPAKDQSKVPPIPEWNPQEYGQLNQQQADQLGVTTQRPTPSSPSTPSVPSYVTNPKTDSEYISAVKYYAQKNGLNITDNDIKTIAYAFSGNPNVSSIVESMRGGDLDESHPFHPKNAAINYANNKQQVVDDAIKNLTLNVVQNQYAVGMGGGASGPNDAAVAVENASKQLEEFIGNAVRAGLATPENVQNIVDKTVSFYQDAIDQFAKERESGLFPKIVSFAANAIVAAGSGGLSLPKQLAIRAAMSLASGANPSDIARDVVGTLAAAQIGGDSKIGAINDFNEAVLKIGSPELQSAIFNGARQGVYSTVTQQDIAKNMAAGALAGAIATNVQGKYKDPALSNAVGEFVQAKIAGKSDFEAISAAVSGYATEEQKANAKKVISEEISGLPLEQVQALGYKTQDEITGSLFPEEKPLQVDVYGGAGTEERTLQPVEVTGQRDPELNLIRRDMIRTGRDAQEGTKQLSPVEVTAQREEDISEPQRLITESTQEPTQQEAEVQRPVTEPVLLGLLGGGRGATIPRTQRTPNEREAASMQALSQALSIGDPGNALFGSGLGRRRNVWNVESLRLKDELGG
jgi:hypothetical protein